MCLSLYKTMYNDNIYYMRRYIITTNIYYYTRRCITTTFINIQEDI